MTTTLKGRWENKGVDEGWKTCGSIDENSTADEIKRHLLEGHNEHMHRFVEEGIEPTPAMFEGRSLSQLRTLADSLFYGIRFGECEKAREVYEMVLADIARREKQGES
jgi:hypothetical protein